MDITTSILNNLITLFGQDVTVYRENVKAGFKEDSFFIPAASAKSKGQLNDTNNIVLSCQVIYFPRLNNINDDIQAVMDNLLINFNKVCKTYITNRDFTISDDSLVFTFDVMVLTKPLTDGAPFKTIDTKGRDKDGR